MKWKKKKILNRGEKLDINCIKFSIINVLTEEQWSRNKFFALLLCFSIVVCAFVKMAGTEEIEYFFFLFLSLLLNVFFDQSITEGRDSDKYTQYLRSTEFWIQIQLLCECPMLLPLAPREFPGKRSSNNWIIILCRLHGEQQSHCSTPLLCLAKNQRSTAEQKWISMTGSFFFFFFSLTSFFVVVFIGEERKFAFCIWIVVSLYPLPFLRLIEEQSVVDRAA